VLLVTGAARQGQTLQDSTEYNMHGKNVLR